MYRSPQQNHTRRNFLKFAVAANISAAYLSSFSAWAAPAGKKIRHAAVGLSGRGARDLHDIASHPRVRIVALCDIDRAALDTAAKKFPKARLYQDWRTMLAKEADTIDSVCVSTPDHMHAPIAMRAMQLGKHVFCQKPLTHTVYEGRQLMKIAAEKKLVTQMGTQIASLSSNRMAEKLLKEGAIGKIKEFYCWSNKGAGNRLPAPTTPLGPAIQPTAPVKKPLSPIEPPPATLDWDGWIGVAPVRPYRRRTYHPGRWRKWKDFGCGRLGDMGCHILNTPLRTLDMAAPIQIQTQVEPEWIKDATRYREQFPRWEIIKYTFPGNKRTAGKTVALTWSDGGQFPLHKLKPLVGNQPLPIEGMLAVGTKGVLLLPHVGIAPQLFPKKKIAHVIFPHTDHHHQYIDAILKNNPAMPISRFRIATPLSEAVLLGVIAARFPGKKLLWDTKAMKFTNLPAANAFLRTTYRKGWEEKGLSENA